MWEWQHRKHRLASNSYRQVCPVPGRGLHSGGEVDWEVGLKGKLGNTSWPVGLVPGLGLHSGREIDCTVGWTQKLANSSLPGCPVPGRGLHSGREVDRHIGCTHKLGNSSRPVCPVPGRGLHSWREVDCNSYRHTSMAIDLALSARLLDEECTAIEKELAMRRYTQATQ